MPSSLRGSGSRAAARPPFIVDMLPPGTVTAFTNMANAEALRPDSRKKLDLSLFSEAKLTIVTNAASASANTPKVVGKYHTANSITLGDFVALCTSALECVIPSTANQTVESSWLPLAAGAKAAAGVWVAITTAGGDGVADPSFGSIYLSFR